MPIISSSQVSLTRVPTNPSPNPNSSSSSRFSSSSNDRSSSAAPPSQGTEVCTKNSGEPCCNDPKCKRKKEGPDPFEMLRQLTLTSHEKPNDIPCQPCGEPSDKDK